ncbi:MAG: type II secretion system GspH family protein [Clostridiales bacterium]|jgi:prepilin-type N-terminal cleavage/methylation domain-containing protein|nr:type II secretion system GspH family protein [Clostridiales bacterium]
MKSNRGFSYIEVLIALAIFCIVLLSVLPTVAKAGADSRAAADGYRAQLCAQEILLVARDALNAGLPPQAEVENYIGSLAEKPFAYGYWLTGTDEGYTSPNAPDIIPASAITGLPETGDRPGYLLVVAVWTPDGRLAGRSAAMVYV